MGDEVNTSVVCRHSTHGKLCGARMQGRKSTVIRHYEDVHGYSGANDNLARVLDKEVI